MFLVGTYFRGRIFWYEEQGIETIFFCFIIPLIPVRSLFVVGRQGEKRQGMYMGLHPGSVLSTYLTWWPIPIAMSLSIWNPAIAWSTLLIALTLTALSLLVAYRTGKSKQLLRHELGRAVQCNALPQWLDQYNQEVVKRRGLILLRKHLKRPMADWQALQLAACDQQTLRLLLVQAAYSYALYGEQHNADLRHELLNMLSTQFSADSASSLVASSSTGKPS